MNLAILNTLSSLGIEASEVYYQLSPNELTAQTLRLEQGRLNEKGALCVNTGRFTGRSPKDRFIVKDARTAATVDWGEVNIAFEAAKFDRLYDKVCGYLSRKKAIWVRDSYACAADRFRLNVRVITETPWANLFCNHLFLRPEPSELPYDTTDWLIIQAPGFLATPGEDGTRQANFSIINFSRKIILIGGTAYTGEIKKALFGVLNMELPFRHKVVSMHCAANEGEKGDVALFFGLSGTGKTTLSTDPGRCLIGDDEHGWGEGMVFNFEGGCYAKCIRLDPAKEPEIYNAIGPGTLLENVVFQNGTNQVDFNNDSISENTRAAYPIHYIANAKQPSVAGNPRNIFFLTCDAFGVLPPISKLTRAQAMFHYISGYTAKIAGTEVGISEPQPVFSACFGKVFLPLHPVEYAELLGALLKNHPEINVWLINTGWTAGGFGQGSRIPLSYTRRMIQSALSGELDNIDYHTDQHFNVSIPAHVNGIPANMLNPRNSWENDDRYEEAANHLAELFITNFQKYAEKASPETRAAMPRILSSHH